MPHNRREREQEIRPGRFEFAVFDGEFSVFNAALVAVDLYVTGGTYTIQYIKDTLGDFGQNVATRMIAEGINPTSETIYGGVMVFQTWENPLPGITDRIGFNKFVPYIAARKVSPPSPVAREDQYLVGRWTGGKDRLAVRRGNVILCQSRIEDSVATLEVGYGDGRSEDQYLVGDWTGDGKDKLAVRRGNQIFYQQNIGDGNGVVVAYGNGNSEDQYLVGDWTGDGKDKLAVRRGNKVFYQQSIGDGAGVEVAYGDGNSEDQYLVGDWTGDGKDKLAVRRGTKVFYQQSIGDGIGVEVSFGDPGDIYLVGD